MHSVPPRTPEEHQDALRALLGDRPVVDLPVDRAIG